LRAGKFASLEQCGTGHAANCELNYTLQRADGSVDISEALKVNTEFDLSRQLWSHLIRKGAIPDPRAFIHPCPHMSFVWGTPTRQEPFGSRSRSTTCCL
jgi:malate dehydrogenase (quinone)